MDLTFEDSHLVPQHHDLDALVRVGSRRGSDKAEKPAYRNVEEGEDHGG
jgi:hypothetical protein